jgi:hypothetical protein
MHLKKMKKMRLKMLMEIKKSLIFYEDKFGQDFAITKATLALFILL